MAVARFGRSKPQFAKKLTAEFKDFSGGKNDKFSPLLLADNEVSDIQNFTYDEKGTLQKRKGFVKHYAADFGVGPVKGMYNYRKENGTSQIIIACDGKLFYDKPQFTVMYDTQSDWETSGTFRKWVDTTAVVGDLVHSRGLGGMAGWVLGSRWASLAGPTLLFEGEWRTNTIDISTITDKTTGTVTVGQTLPAGTSIVIETRVSPDGTTWDAWLALGGGNSIQTVGTRNFLQVRARFNSTNRLTASLQSLQVKFDTTPAVTVMVSGLSTSERWAFATMNDILWGVDGADANRKWDGTTPSTMGGAPPTAQNVWSHKNYLFLAGHSATNRSRLYFSDLASPEVWPALNFIDIGKGDGDAITGLYVYNDQLVITKDRSTWILQGDGPTTFVLRKATDEAGATSGKSFVTARNNMGMLSREGFFFFDGVRAVLASEKVEKTFKGMNQKQLQQVASVLFNKKIYIALPEGSSQLSNNAVLVFDTLRTAWTVFRGIKASEFVIWRQQNADTLLFGSSEKGQVYDLETGYNDDGAAIDAYVITKAMDFGSAVLLSLVRRCLLNGKNPDGGSAQLVVSFFKNLGAETATQTLTFTDTLNILVANPGVVGVGPVHTLAMKVRNNIVDQGLSIYSLAMEYVRKGVRATG